MTTIKHRYTGAVLYESSDATLCACVESAVKRGANLRDANLGGAYLQGADLQGADLQDANLRYANLQDADLRDANLRYANLQDAYLRDAKGLASNEDAIAMLDVIRTHVIEHGDALQMSDWHAHGWTPDTPVEHACKTAHCLAGWAQALSPDPEIRKVDALTAGIRLIPIAAHKFYDNDSDVRKWLKNREYAEANRLKLRKAKEAKV